MFRIIKVGLPLDLEGKSLRYRHLRTKIRPFGRLPFIVGPFLNDLRQSIDQLSLHTR